MKPFKKGLLVGLLLAFSCVGFMASKSNQVGTYLAYGDSNILDTRTGQIYMARYISEIHAYRHIPWSDFASNDEIEYYKNSQK